jgi:hypothetical protein
MSFFLLSFLSHFLEKHTWTFKKQSSPPICNLIDFGHPSFNYSLFGFWCFLKFGFFSISSLGILFNLIFILFGPFTCNFSIYVFYIFIFFSISSILILLPLSF